MKKAKRFVSGLLAALCIFSMCSFPASAHSENDHASHIHEIPVATNVVTPRAPLCPTCGNLTTLRWETRWDYGVTSYRCPRGSGSFHAIFIDGNIAWCTHCNLYCGVAYIARKYEVCPPGWCPDVDLT